MSRYKKLKPTYNFPTGNKYAVDRSGFALFGFTTGFSSKKKALAFIKKKGGGKLIIRRK